MLKKLALIALLPWMTSCGPYLLKYWLVTVDASNTDVSKLPTACFARAPDAPQNSTDSRDKNAALVSGFRQPQRWTTWEVKDKQYFLQVDPALTNALEGFAQVILGGNSGALTAFTVIEGTDGKAFSATFTKKTKAQGDDTPQLTDTLTLTVNFVNQEAATSGTIQMSVARTCTGTGTSCDLQAVNCVIPALPFSARKIEGVTNTIQVAPAPHSAAPAGNL
jgi:hypothetical protein